MSNELKYPHLFEPIKIRGVTFKNRIISAPHGNAPNVLSYDHTGHTILTKDGVDFYGSFARGGAAAVNLGEHHVDPDCTPTQGCFNSFNVWTLSTLRLFANLCHVYGANASAEISHAGHWVPSGPDRKFYGPSNQILPNGNECHEMTEADLERIADYFGEAALMAKRAGFDMVLVHGGHNWLLQQFMSPLENHRTDKYGGSLENRVCFPIMCLKRIREYIGEDMVIEYRISGAELTPGGMTQAEVIEAVKLIEPYIDIVQCSAGVLTNRDPITYGMMHPVNFMKAGCNAYLAAEMKKHVKIPVTAIGAINDPELAEKLLAEGACDFVAMARSFIADPDWGEKAREGRAEDIRPCIRCLRCLDMTYSGRFDSKKRERILDREHCTMATDCAVNPHVGIDPIEHMIRPAAREKKVLVAGGGPAGMQAALRCAERGHNVILCEEKGELGGQLNYSEHVNFKRDMLRFRNYLSAQVNKNDRIDVRLNTKATPEFAKAERVDAVIVAIGATSVIPPIPGVDGQNVMTAVDAFANPEKVGGRPVIIGGGSVGCELSVYLASFGKKPTLIEMTDVLMPNVLPADGLYTRYYMDHEYDIETASMNIAKEVPDKVDIRMETRCKEIRPDGVAIEDKNGTGFIECDTVILAAGMKPRAAERDEFNGSAFDVISVGDCLRVKDIYNATSTGYFAGSRI